MSKVSIIVPVYNSAEVIKGTVDSVLAQSCQDWTLIVVDDCSTDQTRQVLHQMAATDGRIVVLSTERNSGPARARNIGIQYALAHATTYLAFLDSDDSYEANYLERMVSVAEESKADVVWCNYYEWVVGRPEGKHIVAHPFHDEHIDQRDALKLFFHRTLGLGSLWNKLYKASVIQKHGLLLNEERVRAEDWEFNLQLFTAGVSLYAIPDVLYNYIRQAGTSVMQTFREKDFELFKRSVSLLGDVAERANYGGGCEKTLTQRSENL